MMTEVVDLPRGRGMAGEVGYFYEGGERNKQRGMTGRSGIKPAAWWECPKNASERGEEARPGTVSTHLSPRPLAEVLQWRSEPNQIPPPGVGCRQWVVWMINV